MDALCATDADRECVSLLEERIGHPAHLSSTRTAGGCTCSDCFPGLLPASDFEEPPADSRAGTDAGGGAGKVGDDPDGGGLDSDGGWTLAGVAAPHPAGERRPGHAGPSAHDLALAATAPSQSVSSPAALCERTRRPAISVVKTFASVSPNFSKLRCAKPPKCESSLTIKLDWKFRSATFHRAR